MNAEFWQPMDLCSSELAWSEQCTYVHVGQWRHPLDLSSHSFGGTVALFAVKS